MPFLCFRNPLPDFFTAVIKEDAEYVEHNVQRFAGKFEERETDGVEGIVNGVAAIHYAALFNKPAIMELLLPFEYGLRTKEPMQIITPCLPNAKAFQLSSGQDCLHIALARGHFELAKDILAYRPQNQPQLIGNVDDDGHSHLMILCYFNLNEQIAHLISQPYALLNEFQVFIQGRGFLQVLCFMKRLDTLRFVFQMLDKYPQLVEAFYMQLTGVHKGMTVFEFIDADIDFAKCSSDANAKAPMRQALITLLPQAIKFLQKDMRRFGTHLGEFFKAAKFEMPGFESEHKFSEFSQGCSVQLCDIDGSKQEPPHEISEGNIAEEVPVSSQVSDSPKVKSVEQASEKDIKFQAPQEDEKPQEGDVQEEIVVKNDSQPEEEKPKTPKKRLVASKSVDTDESSAEENEDKQDQ